MTTSAEHARALVAAKTHGTYQAVAEELLNEVFREGGPQALADVVTEMAYLGATLVALAADATCSESGEVLEAVLMARAIADAGAP